SIADRRLHDNDSGKSPAVRWRPRGVARPTPFFDNRTKVPRAVPRVLTQSEGTGCRRTAVGFPCLPVSTTASLFHGLEDIPQRLRALAESDDAARADARYWLGASIHHQGTIYPATPPAIPFLVRLAADRGVKDRPWIVHFLADLAVSTPGRWLWAGF